MIPSGWFEFQFKNIIYSVSKITASFISEKSLNLIKEGKTSIKIPINVDKNIFLKIIKAAEGETVEFLESEMKELLVISKEISCKELVSFASKFIEINDNNFYELLEFGLDEAVSYAAAKFLSLDPKKVSSLKFEIIEKIINDKNFKVSSEDDLFAFIYEVSKEANNKKLLSLVNADKLSDSCFTFYLKEIGLEQIPRNKQSDILSRILNFLPEPAIPKREVEEEHYNVKECNGSVIQELISQNINVTATSSSCVHKNMKPENIFIPSMKKFFNSADSPNQYVLVDFGTIVRVDSYDIQCQKDWGCTPMNWDIEMSTDGEKFNKVDSRRNTDVREKHDKFELKEKKFGRFLKIVQTGLNSHDGNDLIIGTFDVFGGYKPQQQ